MRAAIDIALKDLRQRVRDRSAILVAVVAPFLLATLFSVMLGGIDQDFHADWGLVDLDGGDVARFLADGPIEAMESAGIVTLSRYGRTDEARAAVEDGTVATAIVIPEGFSDAVRSGVATQVELITDPDASVSAEVARSVLERFTSQVEAVGLSVATAFLAGNQLPDDGTSERLAARALELAEPVSLREDAEEGRTAPLATYFAAAMSILFVFLGAQFGVISLITEKRTRTLSRILAAPVHPASIVAGKVLVAMILAIVSMSIIVIGTALLLGAHWGDPMALAALIVAASLAATGIALLATGFARTEDQAGAAVAIVTITLAILGGSFFPISQSPEIMAQLSLFTPHAWYLRAIDDISTGGGIVSSLGPLLVLTVLGIVTGGIGILRARRLVIS